MTPRPVPRRDGRSRPGRVLTLLATPVLAASVLSAASGPEPATASPATTPPSTSSAPVAADFASLPGEAEPVAVTLITGDTVHWVDAGDRNPRVAEIEEAPRDVSVRFDQSGTQEDFYVIPSDVMAQVVAGSVDRELFNIPSLVRQGLDDESTGGELPVIVTFDDAADEKELESHANALPAASEAQGVEGIQGAGVKVDRGNAEKFREAVLTKPGNGNGRGPSTNAESDGLAGVVDKVLLDQMLKIDLSESVPQIGAPEAWDAGYTGQGVTVAVLDTGVDATHPDLAGQVIEQVDFTGEGDPSDVHGHGTHVASTIAGTGAASDGVRRGVAPDADLISGRVCGADGFCQTSAVMAGMEWAANNGADIVNMSLGGGPTDGTDPLSQLVNQLSAETGTLFVISAGNAGIGDIDLRVVGSPAAADAALAVGAVDKSDQVASFSSRGPRVADHAVKPEITAPGVGIVAARAEGTSAGSPVDDHYTSLNGTSMAAPHVAGAAALLAQATGLAGGELKDALVSTAADGGYRWYQQGTGRVDIPAALGSPVYAQGTMNFGGVQGQAERDLVYTNRSDDAVTLSLDAAATGLGGQPGGGVSLSADTLTVPAHGTASVTVTVTLEASNPTGQESFGGVVTATSPDGVALRTGIGFGPLLHRVTIDVLDSNGDRIGTDTAEDLGVWLTHDTVDPEAGGTKFYNFPTSEGIAVGHVPAGTYTIIADFAEHEPGAPSEVTRRSMLVEVEIDITADTTTVLDARDAVPIQVSVPREANQRNQEVLLIRELPDGGTFTLTRIGGNFPYYATPAPPGELAPVSLFVSWTLAEPQPVQPLPWDWEGPLTLCPREPWWCYSETPAYVYNLPILYENGIPDDLHKRITRQDLVEVPTRFHADHPDAIIEQTFMSIMPHVADTSIPFRVSFRPGAVTEYYLADDRFTWRRYAPIQRRPEGEPTELGKPSHFFTLFSDDRFPTAEAGARRAEERWHEAPMRMGVWDLREESHNNTLLLDRDAVASRGGLDGNQFAVPSQIMGNTRGHGGSAPFADWRMWNADTGTELEQTGWAFPAGTAVFPFAPGEATYRLEQVVNLPSSLGLATGQEITTWTFTSRPSDAPVPHPQHYTCSIRDRRSSPQEPWSFVCQIQPLILLEYDLGLDINNRASAGRAHTFTVTAGHHSKAIDRSKVTDLSVEASFDGGETWTDARVVGKPKDSWETGGFLPSAAPRQEYKVVLKVPPLHRTDGFVALRVKAEDANGGTVEQTIERAYILK